MNTTFARITEHHEVLEFQVTPCARFLYHWLLRNAIAGTPQEIELDEFVAFTARGRKRPYSLRHCWKALKELFSLGLVDVVREYSWKIWKVIAYHPLLAETSRPIAKTPQTESKKPYLQGSNPDSVVPYYRDIREHTDSPPPQPVVGDVLYRARMELDRIEDFNSHDSKSVDLYNPETEFDSEPVKESFCEEICEIKLDQTSQNSLKEVKELIAPQPLHPHLQRFILDTDLEVLTNAIAVVRENQAKGKVKNPTGMLVKAVKGKWVPVGETKPVGAEFKLWYENAFASGVIERWTSNKPDVTGYLDGVICVMKKGDSRWIPWTDARQTIT